MKITRTKLRYGLKSLEMPLKFDVVFSTLFDISSSLSNSFTSEIFTYEARGCGFVTVLSARCNALQVLRDCSEYSPALRFVPSAW